MPILLRPSCIKNCAVLAGLLVISAANSDTPLHVTKTGSAARVGTHPGGVEPGRILERFSPAPGDEMAAFSDGCFWGIEDAMRHVPGVVATAVGYMGGTLPFPSYAQAHRTGHSETVLVEFDPRVLSYPRLLDEYWKLHHPTRRLGESLSTLKSPHINTKYVVWTYSPTQMSEAKASLRRQERAEHLRILTRVVPASAFYLAEAYHQQYDEKTGANSCPIP